MLKGWFDAMMQNGVEAHEEARQRRGEAYQAAGDRIRSGVSPPAAGIPAMESPAFWKWRGGTMQPVHGATHQR